MTAIPVGTVRSAPSRSLSMIDECPDAPAWPAEAVSAVVTARDGRDARISRDGVVHEARIAFGCLIQPEPGDRVLTSLADGTIWIIAVLDRQSDTPPRLWAEGDLGIVSQRGDTATIAVSIQGGPHTLGDPASPYRFAHLQSDAAGHRITRVLCGQPLRAGTDYLAIVVPDTEAALAFAIDNCSITRMDHFVPEIGRYEWRVHAVNHRPWTRSIADEVPAAARGTAMA